MWQPAAFEQAMESLKVQGEWDPESIDKPALEELSKMTAGLIYYASALVVQMQMSDDECQRVAKDVGMLTAALVRAAYGLGLSDKRLAAYAKWAQSGSVED